jgi:hypothetical protein
MQSEEAIKEAIDLIAEELLGLIKTADVQQATVVAVVLSVMLWITENEDRHPLGDNLSFGKELEKYKQRQKATRN